jgi:tetratricopeptide (TPR) repeat protein
MIAQVWDLPYGAAHIAAAEEAVRHADALGDAELAFHARMAATPAYQHGGEPAKAFVTFSWCLAAYDEDPARFRAEDGSLLLWYFKYVVSSLTKFPEVPLDRTYAVIDDMQRRYTLGGHSLHAVYQYRWLVAHHLGDDAAADAWYDKWYAAPRDDNSDCAGCDPTSKVSHLVDRGLDEEAVALGEPVLAGRLGCREQPHSILTELLIPYLRTGRLEEARDAHRRAYRAVRGNVANMSDVNQHIYFCGVTGNEVRGLELLERHLDWLDRAPTPLTGMYFCAAAGLVLSRLADSGHADVPVRRGSSDIRVADLARELAGRARELAARFDARNGTDRQTRRVESWLTASPLVDYLPLSATARPLGSTAAVAEPVVEAPIRVDVPDATPVDELLDMIEEGYRTGDEKRSFALVRVLEERFGEAGLTGEQAARRADCLAAAAANERDDLAEAERQWRTAVRLYTELGDADRRYTAQGRLGLTLCELGSPDEGLPMAESAAAYLLVSGAPHLRASAAHRLAGALLTASRAEEALATLDVAQEYAPDSPNPYTAFAVALSRAQCLGMLGRMSEAVAAARAAHVGFAELGHRAGRAAAAWAMGLGLEMTGDAEGAVVAFDDAIAHLADPRGVADARRHRAHLLAGTPRAAEVIDDLIDLVALAEERAPVGARPGSRSDLTGAQIRFDLAVAYRHAGRLLDAAEIAEEAVPALDAAQRPDLADRCRYLLASVYRDMGESDGALSLFEQLTVNLDGFDNAAARGQMHEEAAEILYRLDRDAEAAARFATAAETFRSCGLTLDEVRCHRMAALALRWSGEPDAALAMLAEADARAAGLPVDEPPARWERAMLGYDGARVLLGADRLDEALTRLDGVAAQFRSINAYAEALQTDLFAGELLLRQGRAAEAESQLRPVLASAPTGSDLSQNAAWLLCEALEALGRSAEAQKIRDEHELDR